MKKLLAFILLVNLNCIAMERARIYDVEQAIEPSQLTLTHQEENRICRLLLQRYFNQHNAITPRVEPFIRQRIRELYDSQEDTEFFNRADIIDKKELHDLIVDATSEALKKEAEERQTMWTKKKSAYAAGATGLLSTLLTSAVALIIHFNTQQQCGNNNN